MKNALCRFIYWLDSPVKDYPDWPPKWKFWEPLSGCVGGVIFGSILSLLFFIILFLWGKI